MRIKRTFVTALGVMLVSGALWAQEPAQVDEESESTPPESIRKIRVLENPYDIASFYRSSQQRPRWGFFGYDQEDPYGYVGRYPIAGYYRQRPPNRYGYSRFWTTGYGYGRTRTGFAVGYGRTIGQNGDLFLLAPTILAPVGPLTGVFYEGH